MKNVIKLLAESMLMRLGVRAAASAINAGIQKNVLGSGITRHTNFSKTHLLIKCVAQLIENETKEQRDRFFSVLLGKGRTKQSGGL